MFFKAPWTHVVRGMKVFFFVPLLVFITWVGRRNEDMQSLGQGRGSGVGDATVFERGYSCGGGEGLGKKGVWFSWGFVGGWGGSFLCQSGEGEKQL